MFTTQYGFKLKRLCQFVAPDHEIGVGEIVDLYLGAVYGFDFPWLDNVDGSMDLFAVIQQECESACVRDLADFLRMTIPFFVQDERLLRTICSSVNLHQLASLVHIISRLCRHDTPFIKMLYDGNKKAVEQMELALRNEGFNCSVDASLARQILKALLTVPTKTEVRMVSEDSRSLKDLQALCDLDNVLNMAHQKQWSLCNKIFKLKRAGVSPSSMASEFGKGFTANLSDQEIKEVYTLVVPAVLRSLPLDVACKLYLGKKTSFVDVSGSTKQTVAVERDNDILLETGFVREMFSSIVKSSTEQGNLLIIFPSPFFIREWDFDDDLVDKNVDFIIENSDYKELLIRHFTDSNYSTGVHDYFGFYTLEEWLALQDVKEKSYSDVLVIEKEGFSYDKLAATLKSQKENIHVYALSADSSFSQLGAFAYEVGQGTDYKFNDLLLIPKGKVLDSTSAIKCFWSASKRLSGTDGLTTVLRAVSIHNSIVLAPGSIKKVDIDEFVHGSFDSQKDTKSLRTYIGEKLRDAKYTKSRDNAIPLRFSRELTIWYSLSQSNRNPMKVRPCAYFKSLSHNGRVPVQLKDTVRLCKEMSPEEVQNYIRDVYPYEAFKKGGEKVIPQTSVIAEYAESFAGHSISLKTALFLHPEWKDSVTATVWNQIVELGNDEMISFSAMDELDEDDYSDRIAAVFPGKRDSVISAIVIGLSKLIQKAVKIGYATKNPVCELATKSGKSERAFLIMRHNLSKKTFTKKEYSTMYNVLLSRIEKAETGEKGLLIGSLIRLITGIESNILCALTWDDFAYLEDYGIYVFQLYRQIPNGGGKPKLLDDENDFRCIPCPPCLAGIMLKWKEIFLERYSEKSASLIPILSNPLDSKSVISHMRPYDLEKELQKMVSNLGLPEDIVTLPDIDGEMRNSNINIFQGDIFRENFRYWASMHAGFTTDEVCYCLGNRPETIFAINYCDFLNEGSQFVLYLKFRRLEAILNQFDETVQHFYMNIEDQESHLIESSGSFPLQLEIEAEPDEEGNIELSLESEDKLSVLNKNEKSSHLEYVIKGDFEYA